MRKKMAAGDCTIEMETAVAMEIVDQLSIYIYVYVDNYQNDIHDEEIMILFLLQSE